MINSHPVVTDRSYEQSLLETGNEISYNITYKVLKNTLLDELETLIDITDGNSVASVSSTSMKNFVTQLWSKHYNYIKGKDEEVQEIYLLHQICKSFYYLNHTHIDMSHQEFRAKVLFPNLIYCLVRFFNKAHNFFQKCIRKVFYEISKTSHGLIQKHVNSYYLDEEIIKTDILYDFLGNALKKFDPLEIRSIDHFYKQIFRNIFFYYFKKEQKIHVTYSSIWDIDSNVAKSLNSPTRLAIYRDVLYSLQIKKFCNGSTRSHQLNYNYNIFKNVIMNNELQNMFFSCRHDTFMMTSLHYKLMKINNVESTIMEEIKKLPIIYKLLKSVHIMDPKSKPHNEKLIKTTLVKSVVLEELYHPFRNLFSEGHVYSVLDKISENFTRSMLSGQYINLLTLSQVKITQISFITQVREFIKICLKEAMNEH